MEKVESNVQRFGYPKKFSTPYYPQVKEKVEVVNKILKSILKGKLDMIKELWAIKCQISYGHAKPPRNRHKKQFSP